MRLAAIESRPRCRSRSQKTGGGVVYSEWLWEHFDFPSLFFNLPKITQPASSRAQAKTRISLLKCSGNRFAEDLDEGLNTKEMT